ncbi:hypothetical protein FOL47_009251 [Perkinsus chesapeaki]|uniref:RBR-type E3 ubiquitin transferase n=1 Tax=Perkinsus chesapeaki TaxID=330153 RepID=A0A7J6L9N3_PERCH|nr:hypothetical protein FOL47_009251 [Perkinsus chesapeaki]
MPSSFLRSFSPHAPWHHESVSEDAVQYDLQLRLKYALERGDLDEVRACVEVRPRVFNKPAKWYRIFTPWAKKNNKRWLSVGANAKDFVYEERDIMGNDKFSLPIHCLCGSPGSDSQKAGILLYLLATGFLDDDDLLVVDSSLNTPLHLCSICALPETLRALLRRLPDGQGQNYRNVDGKTPIDLAVEGPNLSCLRSLSWSNLTGLGGIRERFERASEVLQQNRTFETHEKCTSTNLGSWSMGAGSSAIVQESDDDRILEIQRLTAELSLYCGLSSSDAENLLKYHRYEIEDAAKAFESDPIGALKEAGVSKIPKHLLEEANEREKNTPGISSTDSVTADTSVGDELQTSGISPRCPLRCPVCFDDLTDDNSKCYKLLPCQHPVCDECLACHIKVRIEEGDARLLVCPSEGCRVGIPDQVVKLLVDHHTAEQCERMRAQNYVDVSKDVRWCPAPGCGRSVKLDSTESTATTVRCTCGHEFCFACLKDPHEPAKCGQVEQFEEAMKAQRSAEDQESEGWVQSHTTKCIDCSAPILRSYGCNHMTCRQCGGEFCYMCGARWKPSHYTCMGNENNNSERRGSTSSVKSQQSAALSKLLTSRLKADCIRGYAQATEDLDEMVSTEQWGRLCEAVEVEPTTQALVEETSDFCKSAQGVLARSFVVLYFTPASPGYMRTIRLLSSWTSSLGKSLRLLTSLLKVDHEAVSSPERRREMMCIILAVKENKEIIAELTSAIHYDVDRIIRAGRTGLLHQPGSVAEEIFGAFGTALQATAGLAVRGISSLTSRLLSGGER